MRKLLLGVLIVATAAVTAASTAEAPLAAAPVTPNLSASPSTLRFGRVVTGTESQWITVTITNNTGQTTTMDSAATNAAAPSGFGFANNNCTTLGASCTVDVVFHPTVNGKYGPTDWAIHFNDGNTATIKVTGTGYTPNKPSPF